MKYTNEKTFLKVGSNNIIREYCTMHRGTSDREMTSIGNNCLFMAYSHVAHDSKIGNHVILSNSVQVGGHVDIEDYVIIGGATPVHQFCRLGQHSFIGGGYRVVQDVPPFIKAMGEPLKYSGINSVGLLRNNFSNQEISHIKKVYKTIYRSDLNTSQAINSIQKTYSDLDRVHCIVNFIKNSKRGII